MTNESREPVVVIQMAEEKVVSDNGKMSRPLVDSGTHHQGDVLRRRAGFVHMTLRLICMISSATALSFMVTAKQAGTVSFYGLQLPVSSKWSFSESFKYLVGVSAAVTAHSLLLLLVSASRLLLHESPVLPSRNHAWLLFAGDQILAYGMMSAGSAASGVTNLNRTGIRHTALPNFCKPLNIFCDHIAISIFFSFFSCFMLALSAVLDVIWISKN